MNLELIFFPVSFHLIFILYNYECEELNQILAFIKYTFIEPTQCYIQVLFVTGFQEIFCSAEVLCVKTLLVVSLSIKSHGCHRLFNFLLKFP